MGAMYHKATVLDLAEGDWEELIDEWTDGDLLFGVNIGDTGVESPGRICLVDDEINFLYTFAPDGHALCVVDATNGFVIEAENCDNIGVMDFSGDKIKLKLNGSGREWVRKMRIQFYNDSDSGEGSDD